MNNEIERSEPCKLFEVVICTGDRVFTGSLNCEFEQRLIDAVNEGVPVGASSRGVDFISLLNVDVWDKKGNKSYFQSLYISKNNIIFIAQVAGGVVEKRVIGYPYREKVPVKVQVYATPYILSGQMYCETWGELGDTIESEVSFLPLTKVEIAPTLPGGRSKFDFAAINKHRVNFICEIDGQV